MTIQIIFTLYSTAFLFSCYNAPPDTNDDNNTVTKKTISSIRDIPLPPGFSFICTDPYADWLLDLKLKKDNTVFLYNGVKKKNQSAQYAVIDIRIGKSGLLQCADAAIKLRADFLFQQKKYSEINFIATSGDSLSFAAWHSGTRWKERNGRLVLQSFSASENLKSSYEQFMDLVYTYCGTYSLNRQLRSAFTPDSILPGDILIRGGFPGHAVTVMAVAVNNQGKRLFLLSQGYMPAQDIHLLKNSSAEALDPWYEITENKQLATPEWVFETSDLKRWK